MINLPKHKASLHITHNDHTTNYESVKDYLDNEWFNDESEEIKKSCIDANEIWELQWYPDTPIGSYRVIGATLESCIKQAKEIEDGLSKES